MHTTGAMVGPFGACSGLATRTGREKPALFFLAVDLVVVFLADGKGREPKLVRLQRKGDRLTALFGVEPYCGGAPPFPITAVHAFLVRRAPLSIESKVVTLNRGHRCPKNLP